MSRLADFIIGFCVWSTAIAVFFFIMRAMEK